MGADVVMGSFIKNPGGTLATGGGYVAGRPDIVNAVRSRWGTHREQARDAKALLHGGGLLCTAASSRSA